MSKSNQIGVYVCHCGLNIAGVVDVQAVAEYAATLPNVVVAKDYQYVCSDPGQILIKQDIQDHNLTKIIVASCSPRMHEPTFRRVIEEVGLNPYVLEMVNIREQCSWVHIGQREEATEKAKALVRMAVVRATLLTPLQIEEVPAIQSVLVIGGGIAGLQAALDLSDQRYQVYVVEKTPSIGGHMARLDKTFPTMDCAICIFAPKMVDVAKSDNVTLLTYAELHEVTGHVGNFHVKVRKKPRFVDETKCVGCGICASKCPVKYPNEFEMDLGVRKAIYIPFLQSVPLTYTIDREHCLYFTKGVCRICEKFCEPKAINFDQSEELIEFDVGAIVVATGYDPYNPSALGEYGFGIYPNVVSSLQLERLTNAAGPTEGKVVRLSDRREPARVAFVQCVGSRDTRTGNGYCSNTCCMNAMKQARQIKEKHPETEVYIFYNDIRAFGRGFEEFYRKAREDWVTFVKGLPSEVWEDPVTRNLVVSAEDMLSGALVEVEVDLVVLSIGMVPRPSAEALSRILHIPRGPDGFFLEAHPKLRPVDTNTAGIFLAGTCQGPKDVPESVAQGKAAAASAATLLSKEHIRTESMIAQILPELCIGCSLCTDGCPYGAITIVESKSLLKDVLCRGCGVCVSSCPEHAITMRHYTNEEVLAQVVSAFEH